MLGQIRGNSLEHGWNLRLRSSVCLEMIRTLKRYELFKLVQGDMILLDYEKKFMCSVVFC